MGKRTPVRQLFYSSFISWALLCAYLLAFYQSANTPIAGAEINEILEVTALGLSIASIIAIIVWLGSTALGRLSDDDRGQIWLLRFTAGPVVFVLALLVIENWFYSLLGVGLKSGTNLWLKLAFFLLAGFVTLHGLSAIQTGSIWLAKKGKALAFGLLALCLVSSAYSLSTGLSSQGGNFKVAREKPLPNILLIAADGLSSHFMSVYGYPEPSTPYLKSIADELLIFDAAYVNNANTTGSITSVLNGISPATTKVIYPPDFLTDEFASKSLPRLLGELGYYRTQWSVPHYASAPSQGMADAFDRVNGVNQGGPLRIFPSLPISNLSAWFLSTAMDDATSVLLDVLAVREMANPYAQVAEPGESAGGELPAKLSDAQRLAGLKEDINTAIESGSPFFAQVHLMDTHGLKFFPSIRRFSAGMVQNEYWMKPFYLDSMAEFDRRLEALFVHLKEREVLDSTLVVIFSDHPQKWKTYLKVPLLVRFPNTSVTGHVANNVQLLDLAPTIIDWLGGAPPLWMQGMSLLNPEGIPEDRMLIATGFDAEVRSTGDGRGWQRAETDGKPFRERNEFRIIHCSETAKTTFPDLKLRFKPLPLNKSSENCNRFSPEERSTLAIETLLKALGQSDVR